MTDYPDRIELCARLRDGVPCLTPLHRAGPAELIYCRRCGIVEAGVEYVREDSTARTGNVCAAANDNAHTEGA